MCRSPSHRNDRGARATRSSLSAGVAAFASIAMLVAAGCSGEQAFTARDGSPPGGSAAGGGQWRGQRRPSGVAGDGDGGGASNTGGGGTAAEGSGSVRRAGVPVRWQAGARRSDGRHRQRGRRNRSRDGARRARIDVQHRRQCMSSYCADKVCCDQACTGTCMTCDGATKGRCVPADNGEDPRDECTPQPVYDVRHHRRLQRFGGLPRPRCRPGVRPDGHVRHQQRLRHPVAHLQRDRRLRAEHPPELQRIPVRNGTCGTSCTADSAVFRAPSAAPAPASRPRTSSATATSRAAARTGWSVFGGSGALAISSVAAGGVAHTGQYSVCGVEPQQYYQGPGYNMPTGAGQVQHHRLGHAEGARQHRRSVAGPTAVRGQRQPGLLPHRSARRVSACRWPWESGRCSAPPSTRRSRRRASIVCRRGRRPAWSGRRRSTSISTTTCRARSPPLYLDDVVVTVTDGHNLVGNPNFEAGLVDGWSLSAGSSTLTISTTCCPRRHQEPAPEHAVASRPPDRGTRCRPARRATTSRSGCSTPARCRAP